MALIKTKTKRISVVITEDLDKKIQKIMKKYYCNYSEAIRIMLSEYNKKT